MAFVYMKDKDGQVISVNENDVEKHKLQGYTSDLNKPLDPSKLSANSVFRQENSGLIGSGYKMPNKTTGVSDNIQRSPMANTSTGGNINQMYNASKEAKLAAIRAAAAKATRTQQDIIKNAPKTYQPLRDSSDLNRAMNIQRVKEQMANMGIQNSGDNITAQVGVNTAAGNEMNAINLQQANTIQAAKNSIADIEDNTRMAEANANSESELARIQALINEEGRSQDTALQNIDIQNQQAAQLQQRAKILAQANYNDIQGYINTLDPNDPIIPYLQAERQEKIQREGLDEQGNKLPTEPKQMSYTEAINLWKAYGIASQEIANILGVPVGAKTTDYTQTQYNTGKPYFAPKSSSSGGSNNFGLNW